MQHGRPLAINMSQVTCGLPKGGFHGASIFTGEMLGTNQLADTCYAFIQLMLATRLTHFTFLTSAQTSWIVKRG